MYMCVCTHTHKSKYFKHYLKKIYTGNGFLLKV